MAQATKIKGGRMMAYIAIGTNYTSGTNWQSLAFATNHSLSINMDTVDTSNKDVSGDWASAEGGTKSWSLSSEHFYAIGTSFDSYEYLYSKLVDGKPIKLAFGNVDRMGEDESGNINIDEVATLDNFGYWHPVGTQTGYHYKYGDALVTSLSLDAANGEYSKFSAEFTGVGKLDNLQLVRQQ